MATVSDEGSRIESFHSPRARVGDLYRVHLVRSHRFSRVLISVAFLLTVLVLRGITFSIRHDWVPFLGDIRPGGLHVHHFVWGILLLLAVGYLAVAYDRPRWRRVLALGYGAGAALTLDELALWLHLEDVYWDDQGQISLVAVAIVAVFLLTAHDVFPFVRALFRERWRSATAAFTSPDTTDGGPAAKSRGR